MKVFIGPYKKWIGPYQIADLLQYIGVDEKSCDNFGDYLSTTWLNKFLEWIYEYRNRNIKIKIHSYDIWNLDHTLSLIILPALKLLKEKAHAVPLLTKSKEQYLPLELRSKPENYDEYGGCSLELLEKQSNWILDEMIFAFETIANNDPLWDLKNDGTVERVNNGLKLFGIVFTTLWY
jgi:hypothetical protein